MASVETRRVLQDLRKRYDNNVSTKFCHYIKVVILLMLHFRRVLNVGSEIHNGFRSVMGSLYVWSVLGSTEA